MITEFQLPELGENIESAEVVRVLVSVGDVIRLDQPVLEIETDKAAFEVPTTVAGKVTAVHVQEGDAIRIGQTLLSIEAVEEAKGTVSEVTEVVPAETAGEGEPPTEEAAEEAVAPPAERSEPLRSVAAQPTTAPSPTEGPPGPESPPVPAAPSVRRFAREIGVDITQVTGSGPGGRITEEDVKAYARQIRVAAPPSVSAAPVSPLPDFSRWGPVEREGMSNVRRRTAERLSEAWATIPHVTQFDKADITELEKLRKQYQPKAEAAGGKLTMTAILLKVVVGALKAFPKFNASLDMANREVVYKHYYHIGIAVDTDRGLLVPVIRDVDRKGLIELSVELTQIAEKARNRKLTPQEMEGGTFTISNLGGLGGTNFTPIINPPQVAILGIARGRMEPLFVEDTFQPRLMLPLALSYDHRLIDGADGVRFLRWVVDALEEPFLMML